MPTALYDAVSEYHQQDASPSLLAGMIPEAQMHPLPGMPAANMVPIQAPNRSPAAPVAFNPKLLDKVFAALTKACDMADIEVAQHLIQIMEQMVMRYPLKADGTRRIALETLVAAHELLWALRHPTPPLRQTDAADHAEGGHPPRP